MSLVIPPAGNPVHYPAGESFQFDDEVAAIFENMAERSIPMYREAHRIHASMIGEMLSTREHVGILDVGASTGSFLHAVCKQAGAVRPKNVIYQALDSSEAMCKRLKERYPWITVTLADITDPPVIDFRPDVVSMMYVLQFIPPHKKVAVLEWLHSIMPDEGIMFLGQKDIFHGGIGRVFQDEYIKFRLANGYTREEIDAKTEALKHSMWCSTPYDLREILYGIGFGLVLETTRWLNFSTFICVK